MGKKLLLLAVLAAALPIAAFANSNVEFDNNGGTLSGSSSGLSLSGSELTTVNGLNGGGLLSGNLGTVSFTTGALTGACKRAAPSPRVAASPSRATVVRAAFPTA